jgi:hypothetical protein
MQQNYLQPSLCAESATGSTNYFINHKGELQCLCHGSSKISGFMANVVKKK